jgi:hypothetical protein
MAIAMIIAMVAAVMYVSVGGSSIGSSGAGSGGAPSTNNAFPQEKTSTTQNLQK